MSAAPAPKGEPAAEPITYVPSRDVKMSFPAWQNVTVFDEFAELLDQVDTQEETDELIAMVHARQAELIQAKPAPVPEPEASEVEPAIVSTIPEPSVPQCFAKWGDEKIAAVRAQWAASEDKSYPTLRALQKEYDVHFTNDLRALLGVPVEKPTPRLGDGVLKEAA